MQMLCALALCGMHIFPSQEPPQGQHIPFEVAWERRAQQLAAKKIKNVCPVCRTSKDKITCILLH